MIGYPLLLGPHFDEKIWGGRRLATVLNKPLPEKVPVGESLESGNAAVVANGPFAGKTLAELARQSPDELLGTRGRDASLPVGDFPLLVKFIDASKVLSIQVHPDDEAAAALGKRGKTEAWHILDAEPGAALLTGIREGVTGAHVRQAIADGSFEALLERCPVFPGDSLIVPAGAVHAIGGGILLYEIQETSDITFRLYDWGRVDASGRPRESHLDPALQIMVPGRNATKISPLALDPYRMVLAACRYFTLERWVVDNALTAPSTGGGSFRLLSCIAGSCRLRTKSDVLAVTSGETALVPADVADLTLEGDATLLCGWIADLASDVVTPLLDAGHPPEQIMVLCGETNDLEQALKLAQQA